MKTNGLSALLLAALMIISVTAYPVETDIAKTNVLVVTGNA